MKTPVFWYTDSLLAHALVPFSWVYRAGASLRAAFATPYQSTIPVLCIGNVVAGGGGKTPLALAIGEHCKASNINACFISRGYGGSITQPTLVMPSHTSAEFGDEPLLLTQTLPTIVGKNRVGALQLAEKQGFTLAIMDDGFQNPTIQKTASILVLKGKNPLGNGNIIPVGPLREPLSEALKRTDCVVWVDGEGAALPSDKPLFHLTTSLEIPSDASRAIAFSGIARPELFFAALHNNGLEIVGTHAFADHHHFSESELQALEKEAQAKQAQLICTEKDWVRLSDEWKNRIAHTRLKLTADADFSVWLTQTLSSLLAARAAHRPS